MGRLSNLEGGVVLSGDGRSDSPGHSAKYGAFTIIEQRVNKVLDVELVQVSLLSSITPLPFDGSCAITVLFFSDLLDYYTSIQQSNEVPNSAWCEHEGLLRLERFLASKNLELDVIITDRNRQNAAYIRRNMAPKGTKHYYDIWHIAKGK